MTITTNPCDARRSPYQARLDDEAVYPGAAAMPPKVSFVPVG
jgi:hypothetical protein